MPGGEVAHGGEFLLGGGEAGLDRGGLAEPALLLGFLEAVERFTWISSRRDICSGSGRRAGHLIASFSELPAAARQRLPVNQWRLRVRAS